MVAGVAISAALALVALPGLASSRIPGPESIDPAAYQPLQVPAHALERRTEVEPLEAAFGSAGRLDAATALVEPGIAPERSVGRPAVAQPASKAGSALKPPRYAVSGYATFYGHGTTAMRLPRGTTIIVCGKGGCLERVVTDYGPSDVNGRIIDLYTPDFFDVCGCPSWSGTTWVTVSVY